MESEQQNYKLTNEQKARLALRKILVTNLSKMPKEKVQNIEESLKNRKPENVPVSSQNSQITINKLKEETI
jgi:hypothetical protein